jgi:hypothetical protein
VAPAALTIQKDIQEPRNVPAVAYTSNQRTLHFHASQNPNVQQTSNLKFPNYVAALTLSFAISVTAS